jgi:hypothetical protein
MRQWRFKKKDGNMAHHQIEEIKYCRQQAVELQLCRSSDPLL